MAIDPREFFYTHALQNAVKHNSVPKAGPVLGALMGKHPEFRSRAKEMTSILAEVLSEIETLSPEDRKTRLMDLAPELLTEKKEKKEKVRELHPLEHPEDGVVMRFAPNPSGPLHLGHARAAYLNDYYVRKYNGRYVLRIEDTDPRRIEPENYKLLLDDIEWLNLAVTDIVYQSDRLDVYYDYCRRLIEIGGAYLCTCDADEFRELKMAKKACPCRSQTVEENLALWEKMLAGEFSEGMITVRVRTELDHPDPAMRDFSIFRIVDSPPHPRCDARVYPLMNFSVVIDDHLLGITHVIRGKDHIANTRRQQYIYDYFGWNPPYYHHYGRMSIGDVVLSTSAIKEGIASGEYTGWDDIHLGTMKAIARRGILPEAVRNAMVAIGTGATDISFSWENLFAENKALIDSEADRYFFVPDPLGLAVADAPVQTASIPLHPNKVERGMRTLHFKGRLFVSRGDLEGQSMVRLKDLFNVAVKWDSDGPTLTYAGESLDDARNAKAKIVQWLPVEEAVKCIMHRPDGDSVGVCEPAVAGLSDKVIQFERVGFARIEAREGRGTEAYFAHR